MKKLLLLTTIPALLLTGCKKGEPTQGGDPEPEPEPKPDPTEKMDDWQKMVYLSIVDGMDGEGTYNITFQGETLDESMHHVNYYNEKTTYFYVKDNMMLITGKTNPLYVVNMENEDLYKYNKDTTGFDLTGNNAKKVSEYGLDYGYTHEYLYYGIRNWYSEEKVKEVSEGKYSFELDSRRYFEIEVSDHDGVMRVDKIFLLYKYNETTYMRYWTEITSYSCTFPEGINLPTF